MSPEGASAAGTGRPVREALRPGTVPLWQHPEWTERFPWLVQGTTGAGEAEVEFDLGLSGAQPVGTVLQRWSALRDATEMATAVHARQVHGTRLREHGETPSPGLFVLEGVDGHLTDRADVLLTVSVADCVPVSLVDASQRVVALVHAGWRGAAGGIVERALEHLRAGYGARHEDLWVHCGPAICGRCYEVGPEVHSALRPQGAVPAGPALLDLRAAIAERVVAQGVPRAAVSVSAHCTRCGPGSFFSHRNGSAARQMGLLGVRA